jgi:hypothetical protein
MLLAETYKRARQTEDSLNQLAEAAKVIEATQERWVEAELHRQHGILLLSLHQHNAAEDNYRHALSIARRQDAKFWELRARGLSRFLKLPAHRATPSPLSDRAYQNLR